jgi:hypothetical protein
MGMLFANLAMTKLEFFEERRSAQVRGLATVLWSTFLLFLIGNAFGQQGAVWSPGLSELRSFTAVLLGICFTLLMLVLPIFTTGDSEPSGAADSDEPPRPRLGQCSGRSCPPARR